MLDELGVYEKEACQYLCSQQYESGILPAMKFVHESV